MTRHRSTRRRRYASRQHDIESRARWVCECGQPNDDERRSCVRCGRVR